MGRAEARRAQDSTRNAKGKKPKKTGIRRFFTWKMLLAYFVAVIGLGMGAFLALYFYVDVPKDGNGAAKLQSNVYKDSNGKVLARIGEVNREEVPLAKIPEHVQHAVVAAENKNFWTDPGVDVKGTARGIFNTVMGRGKQGGSTITQQYVKNYYLDQRQTVTRKVKELIISLKVQKETSKEEILEGYLNTSYYGRGAYGIQAASRAYYQKDVGSLTTEEGAYLAALLQAPSQYDFGPAATDAGKENAKRRWNYVLDKMVEKDWLKKDQRQGMSFKDPKAPKAAPGLSGQNGYFIDAAKREVIKALEKQGRKESDFAAGGWTVTLSIDPKKQAALEKAVKEQLLDDLDTKSREVDKNVQVGAVSVDPKNGRVQALYGGPDYLKHYTNNATREDFQPASTFKPIILASALQNKSRTQDNEPITPSTIYDGTSERPVVGSDVHFAPENEDGYSEKAITVQKAMNDSVNSVFAQMAIDVKLNKVKQTAVDLGMNGKQAGFVEAPAMSLGSMGASPLDMAAVYATLDNHGKRVTPTILKSASQNGVELKRDSAVGDQAVSRNTADGVTRVLRGVVNDGTATVVASANYPVAGKTGTSDDNKSAWFAGYTPSLVTTVGLFGEGPGGKQVTLQGTGGGGRVNGGKYPAQIWSAYTAAVLGGEGDEEFDLDTDISAGSIQAPATAPAATPTKGATPTPTPTKSGGATGKPTPNPTKTGGSTGKPTPNPTKITPTPPRPPTTPPTSTPSGGGTRPNGGTETEGVKP
ncbi:Penicillin-binding protein 1* [Streptomyces netropsis]|uniref:Membrane peptidoglycan carboxypeptidase n=1 Tax=Streptomyces syringium TaxID=76729 RepID=A0ABS4Y7V4_9ACTN|nr:transglycosylase domain-containing protein [Streptomyces syringium]MBP2404875.1 membrane peptidoglycan carboxypeptidase [Streptomyces syringium]SPE57848.1 Penicillin-binding protein 1* [Streptomyces netropsis]